MRAVEKIRIRKGGTMKNKIIAFGRYYKKHRLDFFLIFIIVFFLYYYLTKHYNAALGWLTLAIGINAVQIAHYYFTHKKQGGKIKRNENNGANRHI